jgi:hypothetical protein
MRVSSGTAPPSGSEEGVGEILAFSRSQNVERDAQLAHVAGLLGGDRHRLDVLMLGRHEQESGRAAGGGDIVLGR